ncbi:MAG: inorganic phosphate transporter [bacterium]|nr:inorganic phosphate transporter [bacterium]
MEYGLALVLLLILAAEFVNGWTDAPNAIATVVSTRTLSPRTAIALATVLNIAGAFAGTAVAATIGKGIIRPEAINLATVGAAMIAIIFWSICAWHFGIPTSESHALIAGLSGAGLAVAGPSVLLWNGWSKVLWGLLFSTFLGSAAGWLIAKTVQIFFAEKNPSKSRRMFGWLQICSSSLMAFSHGSNDGQKFIGAFSLALLLGGATSSFSVPWWVIFLCAIVMGLGTSVGGMRIIKTMGFKMVPLVTYQGFSAEAGAAGTILLASHLGIPLSTTHTINTSIIGVGVARRKSAVRWRVVSHIVYAWLLTFPVCGLIAFLVAYFFKIVFG